MNFEIIKPFVTEMLIFVFTVCCIFIGLLAGSYVEITIHMHLLTFAAIVLVFTALISLFSRIMNTGIRALLDFVFQKTKEDTYVFLDVQPYKASVFSECFKSDRERAYGMYYLVHMKKNVKVYTFLSPTYIELIEGKQYAVRTGSLSGLFIDGVQLDP